jgi:hypothetical protein
VPRVRLYRTVMVVVFLTVFGLLAAAPAGMTIASPATFTYDGPTIARLDVHLIDGADTRPTQPTGVREASAPPSVDGRGTSTTPLARSNATNTATRIGDDVVAAGDDAFTHSYSYHPRIRERGLQDPVGHNFPYSYDDVILRSTPVTQADGSLLYRVPGSINGKDGFFEIAVNPTTETIFHRTFVGG